MAAISFDKVVSGSFLRRFQGLASSSAAASNPLQGGSSVSLSDGLRLGARTFATAVQALNATISFVNISRNTLTNLKKVVGEMVDLAEEASETGVGSDSRVDMNLRFRKLADQFRKTVENTEIGDDDYLSKEGLVSILQKIGLDPETSRSVSKLFDAFVTPAVDDKLASELSKERRPLSIPQSVFSAGRARNPYRLMNVSNSDGGILSNVDQNGISGTTSVFRTTDGASGANPGQQVVYTVDANGTRTTQPYGSIGLGQDLKQIMAVNELNIDSNSRPGYSVVKSSGNLFNNYNPDEVDNLFLLDETGQVVSQITPLNASSTGELTAVDISDDGLSYLISYYIAGTDTTNVFKWTLPSIGADPATATGSTVANYTGRVEEVQLSADGQYALVRDPAGDHFDLYYDSGSPFSWDLHSGSGGNGSISDSNIEARFIESREFNYGATVVYLLPGTGEIVLQNWTDTSQSAPSSYAVTGNISNLATITYNSADQDVGYFAYQDGDQIRVYSLYGPSTEVVDLHESASIDSYNLGAGVSIDRLSLAQRSDGRIDVGIVGSIPETGDSDVELYRLIFNSQSLSGRQQGFSTSEPSKILDYSISTRPDAYRALQDLKKLQEQIDKNIAALDKMTKYVGESINFIRGTGLAFLDLSNRITDESDADQVAAQLRLEIRKNVKGSLAQAENLESIVVAALTYGR